MTTITDTLEDAIKAPGHAIYYDDERALFMVERDGYGIIAQLNTVQELIAWIAGVNDMYDVMLGRFDRTYVGDDSYGAARHYMEYGKHE